MSKEQIIEFARENWMQILFVTMILIFLVLMGIGIYKVSIQPTEGEVIRKEYTPAYTTTEYKTITHSDGTTTRVPVEKYHSEQYMIIIYGVNKNGEESTGAWNVTAAEYDRIQIGDWYVHSKEVK